jgi:hypothetical protein
MEISDLLNPGSLLRVKDSILQCRSNDGVNPRGFPFRGPHLEDGDYLHDFPVLDLHDIAVDWWPTLLLGPPNNIQLVLLALFSDANPDTKA